jgi:uncharacterized protein YciI
MLFVIHCKDKPDALETRLSVYDKHRAYLEARPKEIDIVAAGPLVTDDGETMIGSMFMIEAPGRAAVEAFNRGDPFNEAGVWDRIDITAFTKRIG